MKKKVFTGVLLILVATLAFGQNLNDDFSKLIAKPTAGGMYVPDNAHIQVIRRGRASAMSVSANPNTVPTVEFGQITPLNSIGNYVYPLTLKNADDVISVSVSVDNKPNFATGTETLTGNIVRASDRQYNLVNLGVPGEHPILTTLSMRDGSTIRYPGKYTIPPCPQSDVFTIQPIQDVYAATLQSMLKSPEFVDRVDFYYVESYNNGKDVLAAWDPNTPLPKGIYKPWNPVTVKSNLAQVNVNGLGDTQFRGYGFVGSYVAVATMKGCGTKVKSDVRDFMTKMQSQPQVAQRKASVSIQVVHNSTGAYHFTVTADSLDKPARIFIHGSGAGIVPSCYWYWQNWEHFIGGPIYYIWPWDSPKGPRTFEFDFPGDFFWRGAHYTIIASVFIDSGNGQDYLYDQAEVQIQGSAPPPDWIPISCFGGPGLG